ncbi:HsdM family class I SAM-dependent methyltransferase [Thermococcus onnurineus]|nr:N-6 DNA methylase [Thermococcus onnurineus]
MRRVSRKHRRKYAQFFTPFYIAEFMIKWLYPSTKKQNPVIVDPALGLGVFFRALAKNNKIPKDTVLIGYEIDRNILERVRDLFSQLNISVDIRESDFLVSDWEEQYNAIICNPPYLKFHDYPNRNELIKLFKENMGIELSGLTNIYALFILKSIRQLKKGGRASFIVPVEFLNSNYGIAVKEYMKESKTLRYVIILDYPVFEDATTTAAILLFSNDNHTDKVSFVTVKNQNQLKELEKYILTYPLASSPVGKVYRLSELDETKKWKIYYQKENGESYRNLVPFSKFAVVKRGIATGANNYFLFSITKKRRYKIPDKYFLPCIPRASYARTHFFTKQNFEELLKNDKPVLLLNVVDLDDENVHKYIKKGEKEGIHKRYLTSHRNPWYKLENRPPSPIWVTVFHREGIRFVRNEAGVYNLTAFHCVYIKPEYEDEIDLIMAYLITDVAKKILEDNMREYGEGLKKVEPKDVSNALVVDFDKISSDEKYEILKLFREFREREIKGKDTKDVLKKLNAIFEEILRRG